MSRTGEILARARAARDDPFMRSQVEAFDARREAELSLRRARQRRADELMACGLSGSEAELTARREITQ